MNAAATTAVPDQGSRARHDARSTCARTSTGACRRTSQTLRAEAIVVRSDGERVRVEADVLADGRARGQLRSELGVTP